MVSDSLYMFYLSFIYETRFPHDPVTQNYPNPNCVVISNFVTLFS